MNESGREKSRSARRGGLVWTLDFRPSGSTVRPARQTPAPLHSPTNMNPITVINLPVYYAQTFYPT